jgi:dTDP-glucose 4,6-dehydratase
MKTLLIIGGAGFFGKSFLDCYKKGLLAKWEISKVIIVSRNPARLIIEAPELLHSSIQLLAGDIGKINSLPIADYVIHAAASTNALSYVTQPEREKENIQSAVNNYCRLAKEVHINSKILYVSSGAVYGTQPDDKKFLSENFKPRFLQENLAGKRDYAIAKLDAEAQVIELGKKGFNVSIARCFSFVGPWLPRNQHFAIGNFLEDAIRGRPIKVSSNFPVYRSYMHTDDLVVWLMTICASANPICPTYNVGSDEEVAIFDLAHIIGRKFKLGIISSSQGNKLQDRYVPSIEKAKKKLDLRLSINLDAAIELTLKEINEKNNFIK